MSSRIFVDSLLILFPSLSLWFLSSPVLAISTNKLFSALEDLAKSLAISLDDLLRFNIASSSLATFEAN